MKKPLHGRHVLLGVTASIAAVKAPELVRQLREAGARVNCVMTPSARHFVTPLSLATLSGEEVFHDTFSGPAYTMPHLRLAEDCDAFAIAPASADALAKLSAGLADDPVCLAALTTKSPVLLAPAMHPTLWKHPATRSNVERLASFGYHFVGPVKGALADGSEGEGRMAEPLDIVQKLQKILGKKT